MVKFENVMSFLFQANILTEKVQAATTSHDDEIGDFMEEKNLGEVLIKR